MKTDFGKIISENKIPIISIIGVQILYILFFLYLKDVSSSLDILIGGSIVALFVISILFCPFWGLLIIIIYSYFTHLINIPIIGSGGRIIGIVVVCGWFLKYFIKGKSIFFEEMDFNKLLLFFISIMILSSSFAAYPLESFKQSFSILMFILMALFIQDFIKDKNNLNILIFTIAISSGLASLVGLFQYFILTSGQNVFGTVLYSQEGEVTRLGGIGTATEYAMFLMSGIPFLLFLVINVRNLLAKLLFFSLLISSILSLALTGARTHIMGFVVFVIAFFLLSIRYMTLSRKFVIVLIFLISILFILVPGFFLNYMSQRSYSLEDTSSEKRIDISKKGLSLLIEHPIKGIGFNNLKFINSPDYNLVQRKDGHDLLSVVFVSVGLPGSIIIILIFHKTLKYLNLAVKKCDDRYLKNFIIILLSTYIAQLFTSIGSGLIVYRNFWIYTALAVVLHRWSTSLFTSCNHHIPIHGKHDMYRHS